MLLVHFDWPVMKKSVRCQNRSAAKIGPAGPILAAKTGPPSENVNSKQFKV